MASEKRIPQEIEFKWTIHNPAEFKEFLKAARVLRLNVASKKNLKIMDYYVVDSANFFEREGKRCRIRNQNGSWEFTAKSSSTLKKGLASRKEEVHSLNVTNIEDALAKSEKFANGNSLQIIFLIKNNRTSYKMKTKKLQMEACFDQIKISKGKKSIFMKEIELELKGGPIEEFKKLTRDLTRTSKLKPAKISKVATAIKTFRLA